MGEGFILKRVFDLTFAGVLIVLLMPILIIIGVAVAANMGRPVFFQQLRAGLNGRPFYMYKFRTMTNTCDENGILLPPDERITAFGRFLRSTSFDELPELFNIIKGDMSMVGPRPLILKYLDRYTPEERRRHEVKPGLTGWAQINGRNAITWEERFALDIWYVDNHSLWLDIKIIVLTIWKVLTRQGVSSSEDISMPEYMGKGSTGAEL